MSSKEESVKLKTLESQALTRKKRKFAAILPNRQIGLKANQEEILISWTRIQKFIDQLYDPTDDDTTDEEDNLGEENTAAPPNPSTDGSASAATVATNPNTEPHAPTKSKRKKV